MLKKMCIIAICLWLIPLGSNAVIDDYDEDVVVVQGEIKEIAGDGTYVVVDDTKILIDRELLENSSLEKGDKIEVIAEKSGHGLMLIDYNYLYDEEFEAGTSYESFDINRSSSTDLIDDTTTYDSEMLGQEHIPMGTSSEELDEGKPEN